MENRRQKSRYFRVPPCASFTRRYTAFWRLPLKKISLHINAFHFSKTNQIKKQKTPGVCCTSQLMMKQDKCYSNSTHYFLWQTPESGIPPSYRATRRYTKAHLGFCLRFSTLIGQIGRVPLLRWTQAVHQVAAIQVSGHRFLACPYRFLAA